MNEIIKEENITIESMIHYIRGVQVMLSSDVAKLYHVETKVLNQTIKRNINRFPETFCFQLSKEEIEELYSRSQFVTLNNINNSRGHNIKYLPYVLTEQGIMMLSGLLKSDIAVKVNIKIIDAFVKMRRYFSNNLSNSDLLINHENRLLKIEETLEQFEEEPINKIFFGNKLYDAYSIIMDIFNKAVKNNAEKFPERYSFRINESEYNNLKSKISTSIGGARKGHTAFTEQGLYMLVLF